MNVDNTFFAYEELLKKVDSVADSIRARFGSEVKCGEGCTNCCISRMTLLPLEAFYIRQHLSSAPEPGASPAICVYLQKIRCSIYPWRPMRCRTIGYPLLSLSDHKRGRERYEVTCCNLNFVNSISSGIFDDKALIDMERINASLAELNIQFLKETEIFDQYLNVRIVMDDIFQLSLL
jgi:Fe-S-cluster containining protein